MDDQPARKKRVVQPVYLRVRRLMDHETGELVGALVPMDETSQTQLKELGAHVGSRWRAELKQPRNVGFHRFMHALGKMVLENVPEMSGCVDAHAVIKRLQVESETCCDVVEYKIPGIGKLMRAEAQSIAFDSMKEPEFRKLASALVNHLAAHYWPGLKDDEALRRLETMVERL